VAKRSFDIEEFTVLSSQTSPLFWLNIVTPEYFRVMDIPLLSGRWFTAADESGGPPVVVVTATTAQKFWNGGNAVGKHVRFVGEKDWRTVVGVVADVRAYDLQNSLPEYMKGTAYVPYSSRATLEDGHVPAEMTIALRADSNGSDAGAVLRSTVAALNPEAPVSEIKSMNAIISEAVSTPASTTLLFAIFAGVALVLGMVGIYGVLAFLVSKRIREMGIRMALGAQRSDVLWLVMKEGARFSFTGIALGLGAAFLATRLLSSQLYGVGPADSVTYISVSILVAVVSLTACYVPARRAMRVDPMVALRYE